MKKKVKITIGVVVVLLIGLAGFCAWFLSGSGSAEYYAQIDNTRVEQVDSRAYFLRRFIKAAAFPFAFSTYRRMPLCNYR